MLTNLKEYLKPESLKEAWRIYQNSPEHTLFSTGGLSTALREEEKTTVVIDLSGVLSKEIAEKKDQLLIGGGMTINETLESLKDHALMDVLKQVGTHQIRNMATISGSIAQKFGWSDIITALVAYKARVLLFDESGESSIPIADYLQSKHPSVVLGVVIEKKFNFGSFQYSSKTDYDVSQFNFFMSAHIDQHKITETGIAYGARPGYAKRFEAAEALLTGLPVKTAEEKLDELSEKVEHSSVSNGFGLSENYRKELLKVFLKHSLMELCRKNS